MKGFILELCTLAPGLPAVRRFEEAAGLIVAMCAYIQDAWIARVNNDLVDKEPGLAKVIKQLPLMAGICGRINLPIQSPKVKTIGVGSIDYEATNVTSRRARRAPVVRIQRRVRSVSTGDREGRSWSK